MRTAIVKSSELGNDWRAERFCEPTDEEIMQAKIAGWTSGAKGACSDKNTWRNHGNAKVQNAFIKAYRKGYQARLAFLKTLEE